jgi:CDP-diacylglycerol---serine O-phosphatidyltransferase
MVGALLWLGLLGLLSFLMVSTWRYRSFKDFNLLSPRSFKSVILLGSFIYLLINFSQPVLLAMATTYCSSGILVRVGGLLQKRFRSQQEREPETSVG